MTSFFPQRRTKSIHTDDYRTLFVASAVEYTALLMYVADTGTDW